MTADTERGNAWLPTKTAYPAAATTSATAATASATAAAVDDDHGRDEVTSDGTKDLIWQELFRISTLVRYYARAGSFRSKCQTVAQLILLVSSAGAFGAVVELLPDVVGVICSLAIAAVAVASITWNHPNKVATILSASSGCRKAESRATLLWQDAERIDDATALREWQSLEDEIEAATGPVEKAGIGYSRRLNERCAKEARTLMGWAPTSGSAAVLE